MQERMHEQEYLDDTAVAEFTAFVRALIVDGCPRVALRAGIGASRRTVATLPEALEVYSWRGEGFDVVNAKTEVIRREMRAALDLCAAAEDGAARRLAELELLFVATKALSWGRVYEGAFGFLIDQAETGVLSANLQRAAALMDGSVEDVDAFDDNPYRSDCGMTKVYATMAERSVVYDSRLGAALALLCRKHLEIQGRAVVPELLAFVAGDRHDPCRNPSGRGYVFPDTLSGREHARWNLRANWLVSRLAGDGTVTAALGGRPRERIRRIEAALFMIGDDVRDQPRTVRGRPPKPVPGRAGSRRSRVLPSESEGEGSPS